MRGHVLGVALCACFVLLGSSHPAAAQEAVAPSDPAALKKGCGKGVVADCHALGLRHLKGEGVAQDPAKAADLLKKAC
jgi:TPR repeat protein